MTKKKKKRFSWPLIYIVGLFSFNASFGQSVEYAFGYEQPKSQAIYDEIDKYQVEISSRLRKYFDNNKFMVVVDVIEKEREIERIPGISESITVDTGMSIDYLPGLPYHPSIKRKSIEVYPKKPLNKIIQKYFKHSVQVLMDTSYSKNALNFAEEVVMGSGLIFTKNGDEVFVEYQPFPSKYPGMDDEGNEAVSSFNPEDSNKSLLKDFAEILEKKFNRTEDLTQEQTKLSQILVWLIVGLMVILLVAILLYFSRSSKKEKEKEKEKLILQTEKESKEVAGLKDQLSKLSDSIKKPQDKDLETEELADLAELKSFVTREFLSNNEKIADFLNVGLDENNDDELVRIAAVIVNVNKHLFRYLKPHLTADRHFQLKEEIQNTKPLTPADQLVLLQGFRKSITNYKPDSTEFQKKDIFQFVEQLNENQIIQLIKDESEDMTAILLAQVPAEKCMNVLSKFEIAKQTILLQRMSGIDDIPITVYKQVAEHFSQKALTVQDMKHVAVDGLSAILKLLDTLPIYQQQVYLEDMAKYDIDLAKKIRTRFVTFDEIPRIDDLVIRKALENLDSKVLSIALVGADSSIVDKVLAQKPSREQMLIKTDIEFNAQASVEEIERGRKLVITRIREFLSMQ
jgi:flagellar motor switch protein FliG/flagellar basal body-associated protein FliL